MALIVTYIDLDLYLNELSELSILSLPLPEYTSGVLGLLVSTAFPKSEAPDQSDKAHNHMPDPEYSLYLDIGF